jgi:hypothetical protein
MIHDLVSFSEDKDSYTVAIQKMTFRTDIGMEPCKTFKEVVLAWETRQPLQVAFHPKNEQMEEGDEDVDILYSRT